MSATCPRSGTAVGLAVPLSGTGRRARTGNVTGLGPPPSGVRAVSGEAAGVAGLRVSRGPGRREAEADQHDARGPPERTVDAGLCRTGPALDSRST
ncbi:hypothetical protein GCM10010228_66520 [Streptomyces massasporeus]|nr:hypothetical protein GCM10010228_66520 [Streptomyces massasporeus]